VGVAESCDVLMLRECLHVIDGILDTIERIDAVNAAVRACKDRSEAIRALHAPPWGFTEVAANHVLDPTVGDHTHNRRAPLRLRVTD
jgi:DNA gyrase/topoisomerase IV subunit A